MPYMSYLAVTNIRCFIPSLWQKLVTGIGDLFSVYLSGLLASYPGLPPTPSRSVPAVSSYPESHQN